MKNVLIIVTVITYLNGLETNGATLNKTLSDETQKRNQTVEQERKYIANTTTIPDTSTVKNTTPAKAINKNKSRKPIVNIPKNNTDQTIKTVNQTENIQNNLHDSTIQETQLRPLTLTGRNTRNEDNPQIHGRPATYSYSVRTQPTNQQTRTIYDYRNVRPHESQNHNNYQQGQTHLNYAPGPVPRRPVVAPETTIRSTTLGVVRQPKLNYPPVVAGASSRDPISGKQAMYTPVLVQVSPGRVQGAQFVPTAQEKPQYLFDSHGNKIRLHYFDGNVVGDPTSQHPHVHYEDNRAPQTYPQSSVEDREDASDESESENNEEVEEEEVQQDENEEEAEEDANEQQEENESEEVQEDDNVEENEEDRRKNAEYHDKIYAKEAVKDYEKEYGEDPDSFKYVPSKEYFYEDDSKDLSQEYNTKEDKNGEENEEYEEIEEKNEDDEKEYDEDKDIAASEADKYKETNRKLKKKPVRVTYSTYHDYDSDRDEAQTQTKENKENPKNRKNKKKSNVKYNQVRAQTNQSNQTTTRVRFPKDVAVNVRNVEYRPDASENKAVVEKTKERRSRKKHEDTKETVHEPKRKEKRRKNGSERRKNEKRVEQKDAKNPKETQQQQKPRTSKRRKTKEVTTDTVAKNNALPQPQQLRNPNTTDLFSLLSNHHDDEDPYLSDIGPVEKLFKQMHHNGSLAGEEHHRKGGQHPTYVPANEYFEESNHHVSLHDETPYKRNSSKQTKKPDRKQRKKKAWKEKITTDEPLDHYQEDQSTQKERITAEDPNYDYNPHEYTYQPKYNEKYDRELSNEQLPDSSEEHPSKESFVPEDESQDYRKYYERDPDFTHHHKIDSIQLIPKAQDYTSAREEDDGHNDDNEEGQREDYHSQPSSDHLHAVYVPQESQAVSESKHAPHKKNHKEKEGKGSKHHADYHKEEGKKGDKGYKSYHEDEKHQKGHHDKEDHKKHYEDKGGKEQKHHVDSGHKKEAHKEEKGEKGAKYTEHGKHEKGHSTKGEHITAKKDEYDKKVEFFDEYHETGGSEKKGGFHEEKEGHKGGHHKKAHHDSAHGHKEHGKKGHAEHGGHYDEEKGHKNSAGHDEHYKHDSAYGEKSSKSQAKKHGWKKGE